jgi:hypothetical protein
MAKDTLTGKSATPQLPQSTVLDPRYYVTFIASNGLTLSVLAGNAAATLTAGFGGWEAIDRPMRVAFTRYKGKPLFRQSIPVLFDGWSSGKNQEVQISKLIRMSQMVGEHTPPPTVRIRGPVEREDLTWVIEDITWDADNVIRDIVGGTSVRMRQGATVQLLQYVDDKVIVTPARPAVATKVVDAKGKTPKQLSQENYGTPDLWGMFMGSQLGTNVDPRKPIKKGTKVVVPPVRGKGPIGSISPLNPAFPKTK